MSGSPGAFAAQRVVDLRLDLLRAIDVDAEPPVEFDDQVRDTLRVVVEDRDIAAGHVRDVNFVVIFDQSDQRATHADHVVVGVRTEADDALRVSGGRMVFDRVHHPAKYAMRKTGRGP